MATDDVKKVETELKSTSEELSVRFADTIVTAAGIVAALSWVAFIQSWFAKGGFLHRFQVSGPGVAALATTAIAIGLGFWRVRLLPPTPPPGEKRKKVVTTATTNSMLFKHPDE
jgi:hypothetical protein